MPQVEEKVPGGKLVRLALKRDGATWTARLTGDFFVHPEEGLYLIEQALGRLDEREPVATIEATLRQTIREHGLVLIGFDEGTLARLYRRCLPCGG